MSVAIARAPSRFHEQSFWTAAGLASSGLSQWAAVALLARFSDLTQLGTYALAQAIAAPIFAFSHFGQRTLMATERDGNASLASHLRFRLATGLIAGLGTIAFCLVFAKAGAFLVVFGAVATLKLADSVLDAGLGDLQRRNRMDLAGFAQFWQVATSFAVFAFLVFKTQDAAIALVGWALVRLLLAYGFVQRESQRGPHRSTQSALAWRRALSPFGPGWALAWAATLLLLLSSLPRLLLESLVDRSALGQYAAMGSLETAPGLVVVSLAQVATPILAAHAREGAREQFWNLLSRLLLATAATSLLLVLAALLFGGALMSSLFGPTYDNAQIRNALPLLFIAAGVAQLNVALVVGLSARGLLRPQPYLLLAAIAGALVAGLFVIPSRPLQGAAFASLAGGIVHMIGLVGTMRAARWPEGPVNP